MIKLPSGVDIKNLINYLKIFSWEASDALLHYAQILKDTKNKNDILKNDNIDYIIFHEGNINEDDQDYINNKTELLKFKFINLWSMLFMSY